jgi:TaqI-like C-terminal specificity domain
MKSNLPKDLARAFAGAQTMPRARLGDGSWQLEDDKLAALRTKIKGGRKTLAEVYGAPLRGIVTGLNEAFIVSREKRDELVARDPRSAELLVPFLRGENIKRWRIESEDLFLINIPKGKVQIDDYPAIRDYLLPYKDKLEARATKQEWFELQQAQLAYQPRFNKPKIVYPVISQGPKFAFDEKSHFINDKCFMVEADYFLLGLLNSRLSWFKLFGITSPLRGGQWRLELREQYMSELPIPSRQGAQNLMEMAERCSNSWADKACVVDNVLRRIPDLCPADRKPKLTERLREWWKLDFKSFQAEIKKAFKSDIPLKRRNEWESFLREEGEKVRRLTAEIEKAEGEIDAIVYKLFDLTPDDIALLETSLAGQY